MKLSIMIWNRWNKKKSRMSLNITSDNFKIPLPTKIPFNNFWKQIEFLYDIFQYWCLKFAKIWSKDVKSKMKDKLHSPISSSNIKDIFDKIRLFFKWRNHN